MSKRIYVVTGNDGSRALVKAASQAQAIRHVVSSHYGAEVASQDDLVTLMSAGIPVEDANAGSGEQTDAFPGADDNDGSDAD